MANSKILTSSTTGSADASSNTWCPTASDTEPYLHVTLSNLTYITHIEIKSISSNIDYRLEYTREDHYDHDTVWRSYRSLNNRQEKLLLDPPMIAKHVRLNLKATEENLCIDFELFGCVFTDGVVSYSVLQGSNQLEDDTYDGQYDDRQHYLYGKARAYTRAYADVLACRCRWSRATLGWTDRTGQSGRHSRLAMGKSTTRSSVSPSRNFHRFVSRGRLKFSLDMQVKQIAALEFIFE